MGGWLQGCMRGVEKEVRLYLNRRIRAVPSCVLQAEESLLCVCVCVCVCVYVRARLLLLWAIVCRGGLEDPTTAHTQGVAGTEPVKRQRQAR